LGNLWSGLLNSNGPTFCISYFSHCCDNIPDKIPDGNNLREERFIFGFQFLGFQSTVLGSIDSGPMVKQDIMVVEHMEEEAIYLLMDRKQREETEREREREREREKERERET
jgi:hypothetical protein